VQHSQDTGGAQQPTRVAAAEVRTAHETAAAVETPPSIHSWLSVQHGQRSLGNHSTLCAIVGVTGRVQTSSWVYKRLAWSAKPSCNVTVLHDQPQTAPPCAPHHLQSTSLTRASLTQLPRSLSLSLSLPGHARVVSASERVHMGAAGAARRRPPPPPRREGGRRREPSPRWRTCSRR
jgi:hypothetical protein